MKPVILASTSAIRRAVLTGAGVAFDAVAPGVDEDAVKQAMPDAAPAVLALELAQQKALAISANRPGLVIGADQVLVFEGQIFDKAKDAAEAEARLRQLRGKTHELVGAVALTEGERVLWTHVETSRLTMRAFSEDFLARYLQHAGGGLTSSVGCYQLEGLGAQLFEKINGDYFAVLGMTLLPLLGALRAHGGLQA